MIKHASRLVKNTKSSLFVSLFLKSDNSIVEVPVETVIFTAGISRIV